MSDTNESAKVTMERPEIQDALEVTVNAKLDELGIRQMGDLDIDHARRTMRALTRLAVKLGISKGLDPTTWLAVAGECYAKEMGLDKATSPEEATMILQSKLKGAGSSGN